MHNLTGKIVGSAYHNHAILYSENNYNALKIIEHFNNLKSDFKTFTKLKLETVVIHNFPEGVSLMFRLLAKPQTIFLTQPSIWDA